MPSAGNNPVREAEYAFYDILTDTTYGGARPGTERVGDRLTGNFDAVFDFDTTLWEALSTVTNAVDSRLLPEGRNFRTIDGDPNPGLPLMRFVEGAAVGGAQGALIVEGTLVATYSLGEQRDEDGVEIEYRNPQTYQPAYALYPANAIRPRQIRLLGCTDYAVAYGRAKRLWQTELYQRFGWAWTTEMDAASLLPGDVVQLVPLEGSPVTCVITKITPGTIEEARIQVEAFEYDGRIYA